MKTIEERTKKYVQRYDEYDRGNCRDTAERAYIEGATEQREIDIENACKAHCKLCEYKIIGGCADYSNINECRDIKSIISAMKGE